MASAGRPASGRARSTPIVVVKQLGILRDVADRKILVRIIALERGGRRLDVREYVENEQFSGFTRKGLSLSFEEFDLLVAQANEIRGLLKGGR